jgi:hypothetical protein
MARLVTLGPNQSSGELLVTRRARLRERIAARCRLAGRGRSAQEQYGPRARLEYASGDRPSRRAKTP